VTLKETEGYDAYHAGRGLVDNPYGFNGEWDRGWLYAREEERVGYALGQSLRDAGLMS